MATSVPTLSPGSTRVHRRHRLGRIGWAASAVVAAALVVVPIGMLAVSVLRPNTEMWRQQWRTRLPGEIVSTLVLVGGVAGCSIVLGTGLAWLVSAYRFPGRRVIGWALVLPLAVPGYILGFVTTSVFGVAGPVQSWWRDQFGRDAWFPDIRTMPGAIVTLTLTLYPYVYLLARPRSIRSMPMTTRANTSTSVASSAAASRS